MPESKNIDEAMNGDEGETASGAAVTRQIVPLSQRRSLLAGLVLLTLFYHGVGYYIFLTETPPTMFVDRPGAAFDLRFRWLEAQSIWRGHTKALNQGRYVVLEKDLDDLKLVDGSLQPRVKLPFLGGYPPWAFFLGSVVLWADWDTSRIMFGLLNIAATVVLAYWAWGAGRRIDLPTARLCLFSVLALSAHLNILVRGQLGAIIVAAVIIAGWAIDRSRILNSGISLSVMMIKPTMGFAFLIHFLCRQAWLPLAVMCLVLLFGSAAILALSGCTPEQAIQGLEGAGMHAFRHSPNSEIFLIQAGLNPRWVVVALGLLGVGMGWALMQKYARGAWLEQLAIAAVIGRLTAYHRAVDNIMLVFLLVLLAVRACEEPKNRLFSWMFLVVGVSLWVPVRANWMLPQISSMIVWPAALAILLIHQNRTPRMDSGDESGSDESALEVSGQTVEA